MTSTLPPPPEVVHLGPEAQGPWLAPPRATLQLRVRLIGRELRARPWATGASALLGACLGVVLATAPHGAEGNGRRAVAVVLLLTVAAALADATAPRQRTEAALLERLGCPRSLIRAVAWSSAVVGIGVPAALAAQVTVWSGRSEPGAAGTWLTAVVLAGLGAATTCGTRSSDPSATSAVRRGRTLARLGLGFALLLVGAGLPALVSTGSGLDLALPLGLFLGIAGLVVLAPIVSLAVAPLISRLPATSPRLAMASLREQRRGLTIPVALVATVVLLLVVQGVVGQALGAREQARAVALRALGPASVGGGERAVVVDQAWPAAAVEGPTPADPVALARRAGPGAIAAPIALLQATALPPGGRSGNVSLPGELFSTASGGAVALATPELIAALGLNGALAQEDRALVLDDRLLAEDGTVHLVGTNFSEPVGRKRTGLHLRAIDVVPDRVWTGVPAVLLPRAAVTAIDLGDGLDGQIVSNPGAVDTGAVVRFPNRPTDAEVAALTGPTTDAVRGDRRIDLTRQNRTDRTGSIWVRTTGEARDLARSLLVLAVVGLAVALASLRLAVRPDDAVLLELGARRRTLVAIHAWRAAAVASGAALLGAAIGLASTAVGVWHYDHRARLQEDVVLLPLGWQVPNLIWLVIVVVPLLAAAIGGVLAALGPPPPGGRTRIDGA
jgi:hypothetical protein